jgi:hypothetical protein
MQKICPVCDYPLKDGDDVVAIFVTKFKMIDSEVNYALERPTKCIDLVHSECFDWQEYDEEKEYE